MNPSVKPRNGRLFVVSFPDTLRCVNIVGNRDKKPGERTEENNSGNARRNQGAKSKKQGVKAKEKLVTDAFFFLRRRRQKKKSFFFVLHKKKKISMPALQAPAIDDDSVENRPQQHGGDPASASPSAELETSTQGQPVSSSAPVLSALEQARALVACSAAAWPLPLRRLSFATELLPLPDDVAAWMRSGGRVWLPEGSGAVRFFYLIENV